ncbi:TPA: hypothetical protein ACJJUT_001581, partial [Neisseria meningitidis]
NDGGEVSVFPITYRNLKSRHYRKSSCYGYKNPVIPTKAKILPVGFRFFRAFRELINRHSRAGGNPERGTAAIFKGCLKIQRF